MSLTSPEGMSATSTIMDPEPVAKWLPPLEFTDCVQDSPFFRESLQSHERELERTSLNIKTLIKQVESVVEAKKLMSKSLRNISKTLIDFEFECIGSKQTEDERKIARSLKEYGEFIADIEDQRDIMFDRAHESFVAPLEKFRKDQIEVVMDVKKKFDRQTKDFCAAQELQLAQKKSGVDGDDNLQAKKAELIQSGLEYACLIQEVQERKKFEFIETIQTLMNGWFAFYRHGHDKANDMAPFLKDLDMAIQNTRENFDNTDNDPDENSGVQTSIRSLMRQTSEEIFGLKRILNQPLGVLAKKYSVQELVKSTTGSMGSNVESNAIDPGSLNPKFSRTGYLFLMRKKSTGVSWFKYYCQYSKDEKMFEMIPYNQAAAVAGSKKADLEWTRKFPVQSCSKSPGGDVDRRFTFEVKSECGAGDTYIFQALSEQDWTRWIDVLEGKGLSYSRPSGRRKSTVEETFLDKNGVNFLLKCFKSLEDRGLLEEGIYRKPGVAGKIDLLLKTGLKKPDKLNLDDTFEWHTNTIASAVKKFFRNMSEPITRFSFQENFIEAAKLETPEERLREIHNLVCQLPSENQDMLQRLMEHLDKVVKRSDKNRMTVSSLGTCLGPSLLRPANETVASIMDLKFANVVVEVIIHNWETIFKTKPDYYKRKFKKSSSSLSYSVNSSDSILSIPEGTFKKPL